MSDTISRQAVKDIFTELYGISAIGSVFDKYEWADICETTANELPSIQPEQRRIPVTEESVIQAGYEGKEVRFRIRGRLFAIRELAQ